MKIICRIFLGGKSKAGGASLVELYISKRDLELLKAGITKPTSITFYREEDLGYEFGDHPEEDAVEVTVLEVEEKKKE